MPGQGAAVIALYDASLPEVYGYLLRRCGNRTSAEELTAETFLAAVTSVRDVTPVGGMWQGDRAGAQGGVSDAVRPVPAGCRDNHFMSAHASARLREQCCQDHTYWAMPSRITTTKTAPVTAKAIMNGRRSQMDRTSGCR